MGEMSPGDQLIAALSGGGDNDGGGNVSPPQPTQVEPPAAPQKPFVTNEPVVQQPQQSQQPVQQQNNGHPAWKEYLDDIPESLRPAITPAFEKWDKNFQEKLREVHSQYEPYKHFVENQVDPQYVNQAWEIFNMMATDPRKLWDSMAQHYGYTAEQGQNEDGTEQFELGETETQFDLSKDPRFQQLEQTNKQILASIQQAQQQQEAAQMETWVDNQIKEAEATLQQAGITADDKAMRFITRSAMAYNDSNPDPRHADKNFKQAVQDYMEIVGGIRSQPRAGMSAPPVMPTNGGTPSNRIDTANMSDQERRQYMMDMLSLHNRST